MVFPTSPFSICCCEMLAFFYQPSTNKCQGRDSYSFQICLYCTKEDQMRCLGSDNGTFCCQMRGLQKYFKGRDTQTERQAYILDTRMNWHKGQSIRNIKKVVSGLIPMSSDLLDVQNFKPTEFSYNKISVKKRGRKFCQNLNWDKMTYLIKYNLTVQFSI